MSDILKNFDIFIEKVKERAREVQVQLAEQVAYNVDKAAPYIPVDTGRMRESERIEDKVTHATLSYNTPYAAKVHNWGDNPYINWTRPGSGGYYLSEKLSSPAFQKEYGEYVQSMMQLKDL
jgi:hypothetical protein